MKCNLMRTYNLETGRNALLLLKIKDSSKYYIMKWQISSGRTPRLRVVMAGKSS